jgi:hypothetical protein
MIVFADRWCASRVPTNVRGMTRLLVLFMTAAALPAATGARGAVVFAGGAWAAIDRGSTCEALSRSQRVAIKDKVQAVAGFTFTPDHKRWGEFHVRLSRMPRGDASVMLRLGEQPFLLATRAGWAWSRSPLQAQAIAAAARSGGWMKVESRDIGGVRFSDPYLLDGAPTAIDAAAARCTLRSAGKIP